ncbi:hypothetical protein ACT453_61700, partial [Bacillus sp. D-CC]
LKREACSSREAVYYSLKKHVEKRQKENEHYVKDPHIDVLMEKINHIPSVVFLHVFLMNSKQPHDYYTLPV